MLAAFYLPSKTSRSATVTFFASIWDPRGNVIDPDDYNVIAENFVSSDTIFTRLAGGIVQAGIDGDRVFCQGGSDTIFSSVDSVFTGGGGNDTIHAGGTGIGEPELLNRGAGIDMITTTFNGSYTVNLVTGELTTSITPRQATRRFSISKASKQGTGMT